VRFFSGHKHQEAKTSRKDYMLIASQVVETARGKYLKMTVNNALWKRIEQGYQRLIAWLKSTAPQLEYKNNKLQELVNSLTQNRERIPKIKGGF
jgi:hypothetical protein